MAKENSNYKVVIKPYSLPQLATLYEVGIKTFRAWIKPFRDELGIIRGRCLTIPQVKIIFEKLDLPPSFQMDEN